MQKRKGWSTKAVEHEDVLYKNTIPLEGATSRGIFIAICGR